MALNDKWSKSTIRASVRRKLLDPNEQWWSDAELDQYITDWQQTLQEEHEFVWGSASVVTDSSTLSLTAIATDILRGDLFTWNGTRLAGRSVEDLELLNRNWRNATPAVPKVVYFENDSVVSLWPAPATSGTLGVEYPVNLTFATDTSTMRVPAWTRYSAMNYCLYRAYSRFGPNQDQNIAMRRKKKFNMQTQKYRSIMANYFPAKSLSLSIGGEYEHDILEPEVPDYP